LKSLARSYYLAVTAALILASACMKPAPTAQQITTPLCARLNNVYILHHGTDSAMLWIPNCFAPGDSSSPNDSLVEHERNMAQVIVTISDSADSIIYVYNNHTYQYPGFNSTTLWYGNYTGGLAPERSYKLQLSGTTLFGTTFTYSGTVSLIRYFSYKGITGPSTGVPVYCDSCCFNSQWTGSNFEIPASPDTLLLNNSYLRCQ